MGSLTNSAKDIAAFRQLIRTATSCHSTATARFILLI